MVCINPSLEMIGIGTLLSDFFIFSFECDVSVVEVQLAQQQSGGQAVVVCDDVHQDYTFFRLISVSCKMNSVIYMLNSYVSKLNSVRSKINAI